MLRQGKPMEYVQAPLGHAKIDTTIQFYSHFKPGLNRHYASDFAARIEAYEERDG
jgi:site-specific recombinase XerD